jgi:uncharacterized protein (TIGR03435 family)
MRYTLAFAMLLLLLSPMLAAQDTPAFEVVSIREVSELQPQPGGVFAPDRFSRNYITLTQLMIYVYQVADFQILGGPEWARTKRYDVQAKAEGTPSVDQMRQMVRRMLEERFGLKMHRETRDMPRYALVMARADKRLGPKLKSSSIDCPAIIAARGPGFRPPTGPPQPGDPPRCALMARIGGGSMTILLEGMPISRLTQTLQTNAGRVIVDKTGLTGTYDVEFETEASVPGFEAAPGKEPVGLSLFTALPEQLGLKLESERGPVDVIVIDGAELPTPN